MNVYALEALVLDWAIQKGIISETAPKSPIGKRELELAQLSKLVSEMVEVSTGVAVYKRSGDPSELIDAIGDSIVTFIIQLYIQRSSMIQVIINDTMFNNSLCDTAQEINHDIDDIVVELMICLDNIVTEVIVNKKVRALEAHISSALIQLYNLTKYFDKDLTDCLSIAYEVISKRTGNLVDGVFVKDE